MKKILTSLMVAALCVGATPLVEANRGECPMCGTGMMKDPGEKADHLAVMLDLDDKQKAEVKRLLEAKHEKMKPAMEQMEKAMKSAKDDFNAGIKKVLNDKQMKKFEAMQDKHGRGKMEDKR